MKNLVRLFLVVLCTSLPVSFAYAQQVMDNAAVLKLEKAGLGDDLIVSSINGQPGHYSMSADDMIALKQAGVSDKVMAAMIAKNNAPAAAPVAPLAPPAAAAPVDEVGVYFKDKDGKWAPLPPEIANFKTGGVLKNIATAGLVKGDINGHINGPTSKTELATPIAILLYMPEGTAATEYQLLKLRQNSNNREFRSVTGGVMHTSSGATNDMVEFQATKIAPRAYTLTLPPGSTSGEYGILPPSSNGNANSVSSVKIYTFSVKE